MNLLKTSILVGLLSTQIFANDSLNSEFSHFAGGAVMAGGITAVVDTYYPEYKESRALIGFGISSVAIIAEQTIEYATNGGAKGQAMDAAAHILGSAVGTYISDKYLLVPTMMNSASEGKYYGLSVKYPF
jgi:glycerol uptake facilitator-like aquaporin